MSEPRERLIEGCLAYFLEHGVASLSLRPLAEAVGTSARLLVYHFGSKQGLIAAVMDEVRARLQRSFEAGRAKAGREAGPGTLQAFWDWAVLPRNAKLLGLLFEVQVLAIKDPENYARYLEGTSKSWLEVIESALPPIKERRALATLMVAVVDGLLLEVLSTHDRRRTGEAMALFTRLLAAPRRPS